MPSGPLVALADVKTFLNIRGTADDAELQGMLDDAVAVIEDVIGPVTPVQYVDVYDMHGIRIVLDRTPVLSVQSVSIQPWLGAAPIDDTSSWLVNPQSGVLRRILVGGSLPFIGPGSVFTITYTVGRTVSTTQGGATYPAGTVMPEAGIPAPINRAVLMQVREMWRTQRGAMPLPAGGDMPPPAYAGDVGFLHPDVLELLVPYLPAPGIA